MLWVQFITWWIFSNEGITFGVIFLGYIHHLWGIRTRKIWNQSGPYVVGYRDFTTKINGGKLDCSIFYPAITGDENTKTCDMGLYGVSLLTYGHDQSKGYHIASGVFPGNGFNERYNIKNVMTKI